VEFVGAPASVRFNRACAKRQHNSLPFDGLTGFFASQWRAHRI